MFDAQRWSVDGDPARVIDLTQPGSLDYLTDYYADANPTVFREALGTAYRSGAKTAVIEFRYLDADYRDEHSRFYSTTFRRYPSAAHRIHLFSEPATAQLEDPDGPVRFSDLGYLGYIVARPVPGGPVGRVMLAPPSDVAAAITCLSTDTVNLFGEYLQVTGSPFIAQDAQLSRCAHAALWVVARHHHLAWGAPKLLPSNIVDAVPMETGPGRTLPSPGLTLAQMSAASSRMGLPPLVYAVDALPIGETVQRIVCRYLNSGLPVIVAGNGHAFVLIGYRRVNEGEDDERLEFIRQDDEAGPYQLVEDFVFDDYAPWRYLVVPLPPKLYVAGEEAEVLGAAWLRQIFDREGHPLSDRVSFRTTAMLSNDYKSGLGARGLPANPSAVLRRASMSKWIWVVEAVDRDRRHAGEPCVLGEAVIDSTDHARDKSPLAWRTPYSVTVTPPDTRKEATTPTHTPTPPLPYARA